MNEFNFEFHATDKNYNLLDLPQIEFIGPISIEHSANPLENMKFQEVNFSDSYEAEGSGILNYDNGVVSSQQSGSTNGTVYPFYSPKNGESTNIQCSIPNQSFQLCEHTGYYINKSNCVPLSNSSNKDPLTMTKNSPNSIVADNRNSFSKQMHLPAYPPKQMYESETLSADKTVNLINGVQGEQNMKTIPTKTQHKQELWKVSKKKVSSHKPIDVASKMTIMRPFFTQTNRTIDAKIISDDKNMDDAMSSDIKIPVMNSFASKFQGPRSERRKQKLVRTQEVTFLKIDDLEKNFSIPAYQQFKKNIYPEENLPEVEEIFKNKKAIENRNAVSSKRMSKIDKSSISIKERVQKNVKNLNNENFSEQSVPVTSISFEEKVVLVPGLREKTKDIMTDSEDDIRANKLVQTPKPIKCDRCYKIFKSSRSLSIHSKRCEAPKRFETPKRYATIQQNDELKTFETLKPIEVIKPRVEIQPCIILKPRAVLKPRVSAQISKTLKIRESLKPLNAPQQCGTPIQRKTSQRIETLKRCNYFDGKQNPTKKSEIIPTFRVMKQMRVQPKDNIVECRVTRSQLQR